MAEKKRETVVQIRRRQLIDRRARANPGRDRSLVNKELIAFDRKHGEKRGRTDTGKRR